MKRLLVAFAVLLFTGLVSAQNMGHVNSQAVLDTMPSRKKALKELDELQKSMMTELESDQMSLEKAIQNYSTYRDTISRIMRDREERRLTKLQQDLQQKEQQYTQELQYYQEEYNRPILDRYQKAVDNVCKREKVTYCFEESGLLFAGGKNLTNMIITEVLKLEKEAEAAATTAGE